MSDEEREHHRQTAFIESQAADYWEKKKIEADEMDEHDLYERLESRARLKAQMALSVLMEGWDE